MHEILRNLDPGAIVLDLGSGSNGSVDPAHYPGLRIIRLDNQFPMLPCSDGFVQGDGALLPFRNRSFDAVIANHCLEHIDDLTSALTEIGRVLRANGSLYASVPDASTLTDHIYQWIFAGGGHVNGFRSGSELEERITASTGMKPVASRVLYTSLIFLGRHRYYPRPPRRVRLFGNGNLTFIAWLTYALRRFDQLFGTRTSVYGWAFYFGAISEPIETAPWTNVCVNCGTGHSSASLEANNQIGRTSMAMPFYLCPACRCWNLFTQDRRY